MNLIVDSGNILDQVYQAYLKCRRFRCQASLQRAIRTTSTIVTDFEMTLAYAYPNQLFIEWWRQNHLADRHVIVCVGDRAIRYRPAEFEWQSESMPEALAGDTGISAGLVLHITNLLMAWNPGVLFERVEKTSKVKMDGQDLYEISGIDRDSVERVILVRPLDGAMLRMSEKYLMPDGVVECQSIYKDIEMFF